MAYFLKKTKLKGRTYLAIYESFYNPEKKETAHKCYKSLGSIQALIESGIEDPIVAADIFCPAEDGVGCPRSGVIDELIWPRSRGLATAFIGHYF